MTAPTPHQKQNERIDLRLPADLKSLFNRAAAYNGMSLSTFLVWAASDRAKELIAEHETLALSAEDWHAFMIAMDKTNKSRPRLEAGVRRYLSRQSKRASRHAS